MESEGRKALPQTNSCSSSSSSSSSSASPSSSSGSPSSQSSSSNSTSSSSNVTAFLSKLWRLVNDHHNDDLICWSQSGCSFIISNQINFAKDILPLYFKHSNMASFIRQLNMYGFRKIPIVGSNGAADLRPDLAQFYHINFMRGAEQRLSFIKRKNNSSKTHNLIVNGSFCDEVRSILSDVKSIRDGQNSSESILGAIQVDNKSLWRDVAILRSQHHKQRRVVEKLIQFLLSLIQNRNNMVGKKRKVRLMINAASEHGASSEADSLQHDCMATLQSSTVAANGTLVGENLASGVAATLSCNGVGASGNNSIGSDNRENNSCTINNNEPLSPQGSIHLVRSNSVTSNGNSQQQQFGNHTPVGVLGGEGQRFRNSEGELFGSSPSPIEAVLSRHGNIILYPQQQEQQQEQHQYLGAHLSASNFNQQQLGGALGSAASITTSTRADCLVGGNPGYQLQVLGDGGGGTGGNCVLSDGRTLVGGHTAVAQWTTMAAAGGSDIYMTNDGAGSIVSQFGELHSNCLSSLDQQLTTGCGNSRQSNSGANVAGGSNINRSNNNNSNHHNHHHHHHHHNQQHQHQHQQPQHCFYS